MIDPAKYVGRKYDLATYNCVHLVSEIWMDAFSVDLLMRPPAPFTLLKAVRGVAQWERDLRPQVLEQVDTPDGVCLVIVNRKSEPLPHCGVSFDGKLLHINKPGIVRLDPLPPPPEDGTMRYFHGRSWLSLV